MMRFANPLILFALLAVPPLVYFVRRFDARTRGSFRFSNKDLVSGFRSSLRLRLSRSVIYVRALSLGLLIVAAARPQSMIEETRIYVEGIDIVLAIDVSSSMRAMDFELHGQRVDRLEAVKNVVSDFIKKRPNDRIGMVAFSALSYTICPLTLDHQWLENNIDRVNIGMIEDGTAIGSAITASLNRLQDSETKEKIVILLTDGRNNAGRISPLAGAEAARALGVSIYTIGAGTKGLAPYPVKDMFGNTVLQPVEIQIDDKLLQEIADITGGMFFRATDMASLENIYNEIDKLETTPIEETGYNIYHELFMFLLIPALCLIVLEVVVSNMFLRRLP